MGMGDVSVMKWKNKFIWIAGSSLEIEQLQRNDDNHMRECLRIVQYWIISS